VEFRRFKISRITAAVLICRAYGAYWIEALLSTGSRRVAIEMPPLRGFGACAIDISQLVLDKSCL
jgi:hypothetical protein